MSIEAMKLMVAEMEYVLACINEDKIPFDGDDFHEALRLGRQAIEQAQKQEPVQIAGFDVVIDESMPPNKFKFEQAQPSRSDIKQEPVAWMHPEWPTYTRAPSPSLTPKEGWLPLYTSPPPVTELHKRQPLTDEEIRKVKHHMVDGAYQYSFMQGVRYAEAAHGIKEKNT
jgi:hypothetical protein